MYNTSIQYYDYARDIYVCNLGLMNCVRVLHESRKEEVLKVFMISNVDHVSVNFFLKGRIH
jgi:hypothetical protein